MTQKRWVNILGERGTWSAKVTWEDGTVERLPCAHQYFWTGGRGYHDPLDWDGGPEQALQDSRMKNWIAMARETSRVILTTDAVNEDHQRGGAFFTRTGYVGVYDVADVQADVANGLRFQFTGRYNRRMT
jgi:hypothetical protein